jgi:hypothetical protein
MTAPDISAQAVVLAFLLLALRHRQLIADMTDGNVERLEREERNRDAAKRWLRAMEKGVWE